MLVEKVEPKVKRLSKIGVCFKCAKERLLVPGHKVCTKCHVPSKCHTCNPNRGMKYGK